jgi:hypothetical protein
VVSCELRVAGGQWPGVRKAERRSVCGEFNQQPGLRRYMVLVWRWEEDFGLSSFLYLLVDDL